MLFHQQVYKTTYSVRFLDEVVSYVEQFDLEDTPFWPFTIMDTAVWWKMMPPERP